MQQFATLFFFSFSLVYLSMYSLILDIMRMCSGVVWDLEKSNQEFPYILYIVKTYDIQSTYFKSYNGNLSGHTANGFHSLASNGKKNKQIFEYGHILKYCLITFTYFH